MVLRGKGLALLRRFTRNGKGLWACPLNLANLINLELSANLKPSTLKAMRKRQKVASRSEDAGNGKSSTKDDQDREGQPAVDLFDKKQVHENPYGDDGDSLESDDEAEINRIGNVPLWWYDKHEHVGKLNGFYSQINKR